MLAIFLQTLVVQPHIDGLPGAAPHATVASGSTGPSDTPELSRLATGVQAACAICEAQATAGASLLGAAPVQASTFGRIAAASRVAVPRVQAPPAHAWQSRAPPIVL